jgi:CRP/FNR family cyclic AMP-dependent transcriptional regulator
MIVPTGDDLIELRAHPFGRVLTEPQLERLFRCASVLEVPADGFVFREGAAADGFFLIRGGQIALEQQIPGRGTVQMETLRAGDVLGFSWMFDQERWTLDARAVEPAELFALDGACVKQQMQEDPALGLAIAMQLNHQLYLRLERVRMQRLDLYRTGP